jgi:HK97 family phage major capsid protein
MSTRSETDTAEIGKRKIEVHELNAMPKATQKILDDAGINVEAWLAGKQGDKFVRLENTAFVTGTGVGQPRGCMTYDSGTTNPGQVERVTTAANDTLDDVDLVSLLYKLKGPYRMNSTWAFNRNTLAVIAKIQDGQGRFVFQPGLQIGAPSSLLGRPMIEFNDMADVGNGTLPVAIADWKQFYTIVDRQGITMLRDPYTQKGFVLFYSTKRTGGDVTNFEAGKLIVIQ